MSGQSKDNSSDKYTILDDLISKLCNIILIKGDRLNIDEGNKFIESLTNDEKSNLNLEFPEKDYKIRLIIQSKVARYLKSFDYSSDAAKVSRPFEFDSGGVYAEFCNTIEKTYKSKNQNANLPSVLKFTCEYISEMSEHYRIFGHFYDIRSLETSQNILEEMKEEASVAADAAVKDATEKSAEKAVDKALKEAMVDVNQNITKNSVTILGIFSGIVLTVVAGLFYSSSVLESISTTNFYKLICITSLVGIVCINLVVIMFRYIEKIRNNCETSSNDFWLVVKVNIWPIVVNTILIIIMIISGISYINSPVFLQDSDANREPTNISVSLSGSILDSTSVDEFEKTTDISKR